MTFRHTHDVGRWIRIASITVAVAPGCSPTPESGRARALCRGLPAPTSRGVRQVRFLLSDPHYAYASWAAKGMHPQLGVSYGLLSGWTFYHPAERVKPSTTGYEVALQVLDHPHRGRRQLHLRKIGELITLEITQPHDPELYYCWSTTLHTLTVHVLDAQGTPRRALLGPGIAPGEPLTRTFRPASVSPLPLTAEPGLHEVLWIQGQARGEPMLAWRGRYVPLEEGVFTVTVSEDFRDTWPSSEGCFSGLHTALGHHEFTFRGGTGVAPFDARAWVLDFEAMRPSMERFILDHRVEPIEIVSNTVKIIVRQKKSRQP